MLLLSKHKQNRPFCVYLLEYVRAGRTKREPEGSPIILFSCIRGSVTVDHQNPVIYSFFIVDNLLSDHVIACKGTMII